MTARWITADVFDGLATLEDGSVDVAITSPPFLALRSYLPADHPDKSKEIGSEATPAEFIDTLLAVTAGLRRVLAPHGSICVELGDTYAGSSQEQREDVMIGSARWGGENGQPTLTGARGGTVDRKGNGWPLTKSRTLIPQLYEIALAYGINPLTGQPSPAGQWRIRNVVTWARPNPPVGALGDKWRPATSDLIVACSSSKRYWDDLATRKAASPNTHARSATPRHDLPSQQRDGNWSTLAQIDSDPAAGAPLLDYWVIPPGGFSGAHYAVFPPELVVPCVKAMCPEKVCRTCGEPSRRIVDPESKRFIDRRGIDVTDQYLPGRNYEGNKPVPRQSGSNWGRTLSIETLGFTNCGHDDYRPGLVLDPFAGSGTTLAVATGHGHDAIGIDLDPKNVTLARERIGPFFFEEVGVGELQPETSP